jgi:hypothetical protein
VDTTDEAFYYAMPFRFLLGDTPFLDEIDIHQTSTVFSLPFLKAFLLLRGNLEGIVHHPPVSCPGTVPALRRLATFWPRAEEGMT